MSEGSRWSLILHGGAKTIPADRSARNRDGCRKALAAGARILRTGGSALDAVEATIRSLEDDPVFNAGYGSVLNRDGKVETDAAIMEGGRLQVGAVAALSGIRHPICLARKLLPHRTILLVGDGARRFAQAEGFELCDPDELISPERRAAPNLDELDTVGCIARDQSGEIAVGTSTGGLPGKRPGRVGDSPLVGSGFYADNALGGVCFSGDGEAIARLVLASRVMQHLREHDAQAAAEFAIRELEQLEGVAGSIVLDRNGRPGWAHNSLHFPIAYARAGDEDVRVFLSREEG